MDLNPWMSAFNYWDYEIYLPNARINILWVFILWMLILWKIILWINPQDTRIQTI